MERMQYALKETLLYFSERGFVFEKLGGQAVAAV
jgi:hypothetical protein